MSTEQAVRVIALCSKENVQTHHETEGSAWKCIECGSLRVNYFKSLDVGVTIKLKEGKWVVASY